jgi:carbon-monoxide dehydrogenase large subunit
MGQALLERIVYDEDGQLLTGTFMEYAIPRADDMPELIVDRTVTPSPLKSSSASRVSAKAAPASRRPRSSTRSSTRCRPWRAAHRHPADVRKDLARALNSAGLNSPD